MGRTAFTEAGERKSRDVITDSDVQEIYHLL